MTSKGIRLKCLTDNSDNTLLSFCPRLPRIRIVDYYSAAQLVPVTEKVHNAVCHKIATVLTILSASICRGTVSSLYKPDSTTASHCRGHQLDGLGLDRTRDRWLIDWSAHDCVGTCEQVRRAAANSRHTQVIRTTDAKCFSMTLHRGHICRATHRQLLPYRPTQPRNPSELPISLQVTAGVFVTATYHLTCLFANNAG